MDKELDEDNIFPGIQPPVREGESPEHVPGFHIQPGRYAWFQHNRLAKSRPGEIAGLVRWCEWA
ncbi:hypothetical protein ACIGXI_05655 [Kitasatospora aureofaciens]|uniref:hypothetical protein n=1 Tax=Kitasatospora aureofaciens TaxID=1894 RepID=UPI0037C63202